MVVYLITNLVNQKRYVGITIRDMQSRWKEHVNWLESKQQKKSAIHEAILKYGEENFTIVEIDRATSIPELYEKEIQWIEKLGTYGNGKGYNLTKGGDGSHGRVLSEETKDKIRQKAIERYKNPEARAEAARKTKEYFEAHPEAREHFRQLQLGKKMSPESIAKTKAKITGLKRTDETRKKMSESRKGYVPSPESVQKGAATKRLRYDPSKNPMNDPEKRKKLSLSKLGKRKFTRADGTCYMADPANPIDPRKPKYS